jgi:Dolichyl-phosphate-mannose-protein mannosyltransferase
VPDIAGSTLSERLRPGRPWLPRLRKGPRVDEGLPPARPRLLPAGRWGRLALLFLVAFALFRGLVLSVTIPAFWGPDEDYHFLYTDYLVTQNALISPDKPIYPTEYEATKRYINYDVFCCGPPGDLPGEPKAGIERLDRLPDMSREPVYFDRGVGVVHPPLYHLVAAVGDWAAGDASILTRLQWVRVVTAAFGALAVYAAWLLAAQVFRDVRLQLLSAFIVAVQPMLAFLSGIANHDAALIAFSTLALAMMAFILRTPPRAIQGAWLGGAIVLALFVKGSALALVAVAALAYLGQWLVYRDRWREVLRSAVLALGLVVVLAAWWYIRARIVYGQATGYTGPITGAGAGAEPGAGPGASPGDILTWIKEWTGTTYRTYWWHYIFFQTPAGLAGTKPIPLLVGLAGMLGLARLAWKQFRRLFSPESPLLRQVMVLTAAAFAFWLPLMAVDLMRKADGLQFFVTGGRYLLPAYAGVAVLLVAGLRELVGRRLQGYVLALVGLVALGFGTFVYVKYSLQHYMGREPVDELIRRMTFHRPAFITEGSISALFGVTVAALLAFAYAVFRSGRPPAEEGVRRPAARSAEAAAASRLL